MKKAIVFTGKELAQALLNYASKQGLVVEGEIVHNLVLDWGNLPKEATMSYEEGPTPEPEK